MGDCYICRGDKSIQMGIRGLIKYILLSIVTLFVVMTLLSLLFPSEMRVSRVVNLPADARQKTYAAVSDFRAWSQWNDFIRATPLTNKSYSSPSGGAGAWFSSDQLKIDIKEADSGGLVLNWDLKGGRQVRGEFEFMALNSDSLTVRWSFDFHFHWYPWEKMGVFVYDRKLGPVMEESLKGLRQFVENSR